MSRPSDEQLDSTSPTKIAFCITELDPGGAERALFEIVKRLDKAKWEPRVYCLSAGGELVSRFEEERIPVKCFGARSRADARVFLWLTRELKQFAPELVQGFLFHGNIASRVSGYLAGVPIRVSGHRVAERQKGWHLKLDRWTRALGHHHICVSQGVADFVRENLHVEDECLSVIGNGIDVDLQITDSNNIREELGLSESTRIVLAVGRLHFQKGFDILLQGYASVVDHIDDIHLLIVGDGPEKESLEQVVARLGLKSSVTLAGYRSDVPELMGESAIYVLSSRWEGMPNVLLQAMQWRLPIVATDVEGVSELIEDQVSGRIVKSFSANELGKAIQQLVDDKVSCDAFADRAQAVVCEYFTWNNVAAEYDRTYAALLEDSNVLAKGPSENRATD